MKLTPLYKSTLVGIGLLTASTGFCATQEVAATADNTSITITASGTDPTGTAVTINYLDPATYSIATKTVDTSVLAAEVGYTDPVIYQEAGVVYLAEANNIDATKIAVMEIPLMLKAKAIGGGTITPMPDGVAMNAVDAVKRVSVAPTDSTSKRKANFGFEVNACDVSHIKGHFVYHDKSWGGSPLTVATGTNATGSTAHHKGLKAKTISNTFTLAPQECEQYINCGTDPSAIRYFKAAYKVQGSDNATNSRWWKRLKKAKPVNQKSQGNLMAAKDKAASLAVNDRGNLCVCYNTNEKLLGIYFLTGPYAGYRNFGKVRGMVHQGTCK